MAKLKANKPTADVLMNSMRAMGYSFEAAIADIVDNSVSAQARNIVLRFPIDPSDCCVAVCDDGIGMNKKELLDAMKYGSQLKSANRSEDDLGRFGLGMKAASLSQCRRLTVASKKDGKLSAYIWDLDIIEEKKDWYMVDCSKEQIAEIRYVDFLSDKESGTIVLWENFDLIEKSSGNVYAELGKHQNATAEYLVFISDVPFDCCNLIIAVRHTTDKQRFLDEIFHNTFIQRIIHTFHLYQLINHACQHSDLLNIESHFMPP